MAEQTINYSLLKPSENEFYDITIPNSNMDLIDAALKENEEAIGEVSSQLAATVKVEKAGGTATAITLTSVSLVDGGIKNFIVSANNNAAATTINGKHLYKPGTTTAPKLVSGKAVMVWYDVTGDCFFIKASATGNAAADKVLAPYTISNEDDTDIVGTMVDNGSVGTQNLTTEGAEYTIPVGYHNGLGKVKAVITGLIASVIKAGTTVGGILGTFTADATATAAQILASKTAYVNGSKVTGSMSNRSGATTQALGYAAGTATNLLVRPPEGYFDGVAGSNVQVTDANFIAANFLATKNVFGLQGAIPDYSNTNTPALGVTPDVGRLYMRAKDGYQNGSGWVYYDDPDFIQANIISGKDIFGLVGTAKRVASGTVTGSSDTASFYNLSTNEWLPYVVVSGLTFMPSVVIVSIVSSNQVYHTCWKRNTTTTGRGEINRYGSSQYYSTSDYNASSAAYVNSSGFKLPVHANSYTYTWVASE